MKNIVLALILLSSLGMAGCATKAGSATAGALGGAAAGGGSYEYRLRQELQQIESDFRAGKMDQREYEIRKDQIERIQLLN